MVQTHMGSAIPRPARRNMSKRYRHEVFVAFERWGFDQQGWATTTRYRYLKRAEAADRWLMENENVHLVWATEAQLRSYLFSTEPTPQNRNDIRAGLVGFANFCIAQGWRQDNPATGLPRLPLPRPVPRALTVEQARRIVAVSQSLDPMERALILVYLYAGLRKSEARMMEWRNVEPGWVTVFGKGSKERTVALHPIAEQALMGWKLQTAEARYVFVSPRFPGRPVSLTHIQNVVLHVGSMAGIEKLSPHAFRHTFATRLLETGSDIRDAQVAMGHASPTTTARYQMVRPVRLTESVGRLDFSLTLGSNPA